MESPAFFYRGVKFIVNQGRKAVIAMKIVLAVFAIMIARVFFKEVMASSPRIGISQSRTMICID